MSYKPKPIVTYSYARRLKSLKLGKVQTFKLRGQRVKAYVDPTGRILEILEAPKSLIPDPKAFKLVPEDGVLRIVRVEKQKPKSEPSPPPSEPEPIEPAEPQLTPEEKKEEVKAPPEEEPKSPLSAPKQPKPLGKPRTLTEAERKKAKLVPVPGSGPIPTPYIDWDSIPYHAQVSGIVHYDYPIRGAPKGMLPELRGMFSRSRRYQDEAPVNILIQGWKATGKSQLIKKFAEDTGLPYWNVIGQEGIRADELLGHYELKEGTSRWVDGLIPRAVRAGGILHIDEANVIEPAILMRLDELLDNKRQLNMEDLNGEIVKAHPDLFVIFTMNPPTYEGVKVLPEPIVSRLTKRYFLDYPPAHVELKILEAKLRKMGLKPSEFDVPDTPTKPPTGTMARDIMDMMQIVQGLRKDTEISYTPSLRETQGFVQDLREGMDFFNAFDVNVANWYSAYPEESQKVEEALNAVRRRP